MSKISSQYRIATWNLDRPRSSSKAARIQEKLQDISADIFILTETSDLIDLSEEYEVLKAREFPHYKNAPWISIWSKWPVSQRIETFNPYRTACGLIEAPFGSLIIYGTIIPYHMAGVSGNRYPENGKKAWQMHYEDITAQSADWKKIMKKHPGVPFLVAGDFNQTRDPQKGGYGTNWGRELLSQELLENDLSCVTEIDFQKGGFLNPDSTGKKRRNIDHICLSNNFLEKTKVESGAWDQFSQEGFNYSDHNGTYLDMYIK